jgi:hypothetical protein
MVEPQIGFAIWRFFLKKTYADSYALTLLGPSANATLSPYRFEKTTSPDRDQQQRAKQHDRTGNQVRTDIVNLHKPAF